MKIGIHCDTVMRIAIVLLGIVGFISVVILRHAAEPAAWAWLGGVTVTIWTSHAALAHKSLDQRMKGDPDAGPTGDRVEDR